MKRTNRTKRFWHEALSIVCEIEGARSEPNAHARCPGVLCILCELHHPSIDMVAHRCIPAAGVHADLIGARAIDCHAFFAPLLSGLAKGKSGIHNRHVEWAIAKIVS